MNSHPEISPGTIVDGRYRVESRLGQGGFATVYRAEHLQLGRAAALKVLEPVAPHHNERFRARFNTEARIAANLDHPHVVRIFDFGFLPDDRPYMAMELLEGDDLMEVLARSGAMEPQRAKQLFEGVLDALREGHERGIVHKDLKPSNLFLVKEGTADERLVVLDYGIARLEGDDNPRLTEEGTYTGTPAYMPPEYIHRKEVTPAYDVYQIGLIFIETMTGQPVVQAASSMAYLVAHTSGQHRVPEDFGDTELGATLLKSIAVEPAQRYPDAGALLSAVQMASVSPDADFTLPRITLNEAEAARVSDSHPAARTTQPDAVPPTLAQGHKPSKGLPTGVIIAVVVLMLFGCVGATIAAGGLVWFGLQEASPVATTTITTPETTEMPKTPSFPNIPIIGHMPSDGQEMSHWLLGRQMIMAVMHQVRIYYDVLGKTGGWSSKGAAFVPTGSSDILSVANAQLDSGLNTDPKRRELEKACQAMRPELDALGDTLDDLYDYHSVMRGWESDGGAHGKQMTKTLKDVQQRFSTRYREFSALVDSELRHHLTQREDELSSKPFLSIATTAMKAEHKLISTMARAPKSKDAAAALSEFDDALKKLEQHVRKNRASLTQRYKITAGIHERFVSAMKDTRRQAGEIRKTARDGGDLASLKVSFWSQLHSTFDMYNQLQRF